MTKGEVLVKILNNVNYPEDVRKLNIKEKEILAKCFRQHKPMNKYAFNR